MAKSIAEYFVGQAGGYGGGAMTGGAVAPNNWAGTFSGNQTSRRLNNYPASRRYTYMQGNTVIGSALYDTITKDDLTHPRFSAQEIFTGLRKEMGRMEYPDKDVAKQTVLANLEKNPKFYSDLEMYFNSDKEGTIMENIDADELKKGIDVEREHTDDEALAKKIAMDHLAEDPRYYTKLSAAGLGHDDGAPKDGGDSTDDGDYVGDDDSPSDDVDIDSDEMDVGMVAPVTPAIAVVKIATQAVGTDNGMGAGMQSGTQEKLSSSGVGKSGTPKPLKSDKLVAPMEKNKVGPNKVAVSKTPPIGGQMSCDPLDHFGSQMVEKW